jgi:predicted transposase YdaD
MLQLHDIRESRAYQEAKEEGRQEGIAHAIVKLAAKKMPAEEIAATLEVDIDLVRQVLSGQTNGPGK